MTSRRNRFGISIWFYFALYLAATCGVLLIILLFARQEAKTLQLGTLTQAIKQQVSSVISAPNIKATTVCNSLATALHAQVAIFDAAQNIQCRSDNTDELFANNIYTQSKISPEQDFWRIEEEEKNISHMGFVVAAADPNPLFVYAAVSTDSIDSENVLFIRRLFWIELVAIFLLSGFAFLLYRRLTPPLRDMRRGAERFAKGDFSQSIRRFGIYEFDALSQSLNKMARQLDRLDKVRRDFIANVSHELKTPITSINGFVETLLEGAIDDEKNAKRFLYIVKKQSERLTRIIVDLLTLARLEDEKMRSTLLLQQELTNDIISSVIETCGPNAEVKGIKVLNVSRNNLLVTVDRSLLEQALSNLVLNAIKYSPSDTEIRISAKSVEDGFVEFGVKDQGPGIGREHLPRIFERFYRVDKARSRDLGGTGLGLAIVKHISQVHAGSVSVTSELGSGSTFIIRVPTENKTAVSL